MPEYQCRNDKAITGEDLRAFADYCMDVGAGLGRYGLTPERAASVASHLAMACFLCREEVENHLRCNGLSEELELICEPPEGLSFENESMQDLYRACRNRQDRKRIIRNKTDSKHGGYVIVSSVAQFMIGYRVVPNEAGFMEAKVTVLGCLGKDLGHIQECPGMETLGKYRYSLLEKGDLDRVEEHLGKCDICAHALNRFDQVEAEKPKQPQKNKNPAGD